MKTPFIIGIAGGTGGGKTTLARKLASMLACEEVTIISFDDYYKDQPGTTLEDRAKTNYDHPDSLESELLVEQIKRLKDGKVIEKPKYNFATHSRMKETETVKPTRVIIVEGILVLHFKALRELFNLKLYVDAPSDIRFIRRLQRDTIERGRSVDSVITQYLQTVRPMHERYVESSKFFADRSVSGENDAWRQVVKQVKQIISG